MLVRSFHWTASLTVRWTQGTGTPNIAWEQPRNHTLKWPDDRTLRSSQPDLNLGPIWIGLFTATVM